MQTLTLGQAVGYTLKSPNGSWKRITSLNPYEKTFFWDGYDAPNRDPVVGWLKWENAKAYDVEIVPSPEELVMIDQARLTLKVEEKAKELRTSIESWLSNEKAR